MERHQGSWKVEGEEEYNIGELVIDNDYIEILYLICDYPHKHYTFKHFEV